ncbi:MAG: cysteine--tRNA ligase [Maricaulaceae bacterium]|nr:cysteine--tRNA ligase [Maricaulaceae bacterium]
MTSLRLHDTLSGEKKPFQPADPKRVTMYVCGPTVYNYAHIGNARPVVVFDVLFRLLRHVYGADHVVYARNFTDVDDKIIKAAAESGEQIDAVTGKFARIYQDDMAALGALPPTLEPKATDNIGAMVEMTARLIELGHAYEAEGHVLFAVGSFHEYGKLSKRSRDDMIAGARVEVAPYKRDPADFVLWKPAKAGEPGWDSPWGRGRPGWHIECSAMNAAHLGRTIDIHGGGQDLVFPHHENEIAQTECAHGGRPFARFWLHNGFLSMDSEKMSKSLGNVLLVHDLLRHWPGEALRYALLSGHYRAPLDWNDALVDRARKSLDRLYGVLRRAPDAAAAEPPQAVIDALADDLNTPKALAALFEIAGRANKADSEAERAQAAAELRGAGALLGLLQDDADAWFGIAGMADGERARIDALVAERAQARAAKDFARADALRAELAALDVTVEDGPEGATWRKAG